MGENKLRVGAYVAVPPRLVIYDLGTETFVCNHCSKTAWFPVADRERRRDGSPSVEHRFKQFLNEHGVCAVVASENTKRGMRLDNE